MQPDPTRLTDALGITNKIVGFYDAPDTAPFEPLIRPKHCLFSGYSGWMEGKTSVLTKEKFGCGGAGSYLCNVDRGSDAAMVKFLAIDEGLKASPELLVQWQKHCHAYEQKHPYLCIGPLRPEQYEYLKTVTFYVNPDQLSMLLTGATYNSAAPYPPPVISSFGAGCMQLITVFDDLEIPQATIGATDVSMRQYIPADILAFTVTLPMFRQLCALDERSFLYKGFWRTLKRVRHLL